MTVAELLTRIRAEIRYQIHSRLGTPMAAHPVDDTLPPCLGVVFPDDDYPWQCTRPIGHAGSHLAGSSTGTVAIWDDQLLWDVRTGWVVQ